MSQKKKINKLFYHRVVSESVHILYFAVLSCQFIVPCLSKMSRDARKPVFGVSDQVQHKPACTSSEKS